MGLPFRVRSEVEPVALPLACDPSVAAANAHQEELLDKLREGELDDDLVVPADATLVTVRSLDRRTIDRVEREAGRISHLGQRVAHRLGEATAQARAAADEAGADDEAANEAADLAAARALDALTDEEHDAWQRQLAWTIRRQVLLVRYGVVRMTGGDLDGYQPDAQGRYPAEVVDAVADTLPAAIGEIAGHITRLSLLSAAGKARSGGPAGRDTSTPPGGPATSATPSQGCEPDEATAAAPSDGSTADTHQE